MSTSSLSSHSNSKISIYSANLRLDFGKGTVDFSFTFVMLFIYWLVPILRSEHKDRGFSVHANLGGGFLIT